MKAITESLKKKSGKLTNISVPDPDPKLFSLKDPDLLLFHTKLKNMSEKCTKK